ncbi:MAG: site-specific integrase [Anaerolineae bacterium]|nr:site-specific integrase [Anaerolineae bacterium]MCZ7551061.1 site-specific integrase [Anaerolineales bacterium]
MSNDQISSLPEKTISPHINAASLLSPTLQIWRIYLEDQGVSTHTVKAFLSDLNLLAAYLPPDRPIGGISTTDLNQFLNWLQHGRNVPCSPKSLARRITSLKAFFRWLHQYGALLVDPAEKIPQKTVISPLPVVLTPAETDLILEVAQKHRTAQKPDARPYALVALLLNTAIKKGECLNINCNHIELDSPTGPFLFVRYASPKNRFKERKIALPEDWITAYHEFAAQYAIKDRLFPWSPRRLEYLLEDLSAEAGLEKHLSFDMCRWTSVLVDWKSEMEHDKIRQKLGVSKIQWREVRIKLEKLASY